MALSHSKIDVAGGLVSIRRTFGQLFKAVVGRHLARVVGSPGVVENHVTPYILVFSIATAASL